MTSHRYDAILELIDDRQPACGTTKVVAIDGPSGSGKTTIAHELAAAADGTVLELDDIYPGWHGLAATPPMISRALGSVASGQVGAVDRWDWTNDRSGEALLIPPVDLLVLDGVGSGASVIRPYLSALIWIEAPARVRKIRALARDGGAFAPFWDIWAAQEVRHFSSEQTFTHADLVLQTGA